MQICLYGFLFFLQLIAHNFNIVHCKQKSNILSFIHAFMTWGRWVSAARERSDEHAGKLSPMFKCVWISISATEVE